jgi:mevalonate kinase
MTTVVVSAPGKVIIHGEHAVVFGKRALAGSLGLRTKLTLQFTKNDKVVVNLPDIGIHVDWMCDTLSASLPQLPLGDASNPTEVSTDILSQLQHFAGVTDKTDDPKHLAVIAFLYLFCSISPVDGVLPSIHISVSSSLPTSAGLGSSAAFSTCLATSLLVSSGKVTWPSGNSYADTPIILTDKDLELVNQWAFMAEKIIHGRPSGIDNTVSTFGGALFFQNGNMKPVIAMPRFRILLINTGVMRSTKLLVEGVRHKRDTYPDIVPLILNCIEAITTRCEATLADLCTAAEAIIRPLYQTLEDLIDMNQHLLNLLGVGHPSLDAVCSIAAQYGLHAKLTGAGGGGCAFTLVPPDVTDAVIAQVKQQFTAAGFDCFETTLCGPGVMASIATIIEPHPCDKTKQQ